MSISEITREAIHKAIEDFDSRGRDTFLKHYGFGRSKGYYLIHAEKLYDSKAIVGAAHGFTSPGALPLRSSDFSGGEATVVRVLESLGFHVIRPTDRVPAGLPYEIGATYHRQTQIHQVFGGQERGGIAMPRDVPFVFLFTGESGGQYGYEDGWQPDGTYAYTGEGQLGDMRFIRGNKAIRDHHADGRDLLMFEALSKKGQYRFLGCFSCAGWELRAAPDRDGKDRQVIVFHLLPAGEIQTVSNVEDAVEAELSTTSIEGLRSLAYAAASPKPGIGMASSRNYFIRSAQVKMYVLARAKGRCEACGNLAPFVRKNGTPYLEPHHTRRLADGGPDDPRHVGAVCPTCHRTIHHGLEGDELNNRLKQRLLEIEA
ncbi:HNH endonuclease [Mesorhizobium sp.]|uniref:HNH endonuclease n=1 Tax=Mesorhizobium sp. TaxID=1871066 RepID=UPI000FE30109|nr:HNH endonuclease [Mesorhizobium sp.]RWG78556.1 MAG: HNH endonuclease [Mesorhizobium sp.]RWK22552.1 MAG: HNH endonuclease [Mesorhizobium sp.]